MLRIRRVGLLAVFVAAAGALRADAAAPLLETSEVIVDARGVHDATNAVSSPDGNFLYVRSRTDQGVAVYARDSVTGTTSRVAFYEDGVGGIDGLAGSGDLAISPDGANVYTTSRDEDALAVFTRNAVTGLLTQTDVFRDGVGSVDGLDQATRVTVAPDGTSLYVVGLLDDAVAVFARDPGTGALAFVQVQRNQIGGVTGMNAPSGLVVSSDGAHVYVGADSTAIFTRDALTGALTFAGNGNGASQLVMLASGNQVYAYTNGAIRILARDAVTGALQSVGDISVGDGFAPAITLSPDDAFVYVTTREDDVAEVQVLARDAGTGALTSVGTAALMPAGTVTGNAQPHAPLVSPDGQHLYVLADVGEGFIGFDRDPGTGLLTRFDVNPGPLPAGDGLDGVNGIALDPDGLHAYAASARDDAVVVYDRDVSTGALTWKQAIEAGPGAMQEFLGLGPVVVAPDGAHVYVGGIDSVSRFARDAGTGLLTFLGTNVLTPGLFGGAPCKLVMDLTGRSLYTDCGPILFRDPVDGSLTVVGSGGDRVAAWAVSRDARFVYQVSVDADVHVYARDPVDGTLTGVETIVRSDLPTAQLQDMVALITSPDDRFLYATGKYLSVFERDLTTGHLRFRGSPRESSFSRGAVVTDDGAYLVEALLDAFVTHARRVVDGSTVTAAATSSPVDNMQQSDAFTASPDGRFLYFTSAVASTIGILRLDPCGPLVIKPSLAATRILADATPGNDSLSLKGSFRLRSGTLASLDLVATGARLQLDAAGGASRADVVLPGGAYAGSGTRGWQKKGRTWLYRDRTGSLLNGIGSVKLVEGVKTAAGMVAVTVKAKDGSYPLLAGDAPPVATLTVGGPGQCGRTIFDVDDCSMSATSLKCRLR